MELFRFMTEALGVTITENQDTMTSYCVSQVQRAENGGLVARTEAENVWAYNNGELWGSELPELQDGE